MKNLRNIAVLSGVAVALAAGDSLAGAKAPTKGEREPIAARGADLLAMIDAAGDDGLMLTQEEGMDAVTAGYAVVDPAVTEGNTAKVTLTDAGRAALASSGNTATSFEIEDNIPLPTNTPRRGRSGGYPFENLNVGQSFHVAPNTGETPEKVVARLQSSVSGARQRFAEETGETETVTVKTYQRNEAGEFVKDADGKRVIESTREEQRPVTRLTRDFKVAAVGEDDPKGPGARVWRIALPA